MRGRVTLLLASLALGMAACGPVKSAGDVVVAAPSKVAEVRMRYATAKATASIFLHFLPADRQARVLELERQIEYFLDLAERATTLAAQAIELKRARAAIDELDPQTG